MTILFDENMPYAKEFFSDIAGSDTELIPFSGRDLSPEQLLDAVVLFVR